MCVYIRESIFCLKCQREYISVYVRESIFAYISERVYFVVYKRDLPSRRAERDGRVLLLLLVDTDGHVRERKRKSGWERECERE